MSIKHTGTIDFSGATSILGITQGDNVVFVPAGAFVPGSNCTLTPGGTTAWIPTAALLMEH